MLKHETEYATPDTTIDEAFRQSAGSVLPPSRAVPRGHVEDVPFLVLANVPGREEADALAAMLPCAVTPSRVVPYQAGEGIYPQGGFVVAIRHPRNAVVDAVKQGRGIAGIVAAARASERAAVDLEEGARLLDHAAKSLQVKRDAVSLVYHHGGEGQGHYGRGLDFALDPQVAKFMAAAASPGLAPGCVHVGVTTYDRALCLDWDASVRSQSKEVRHRLRETGLLDDMNTRNRSRADMENWATGDLIFGAFVSRCASERTGRLQCESGRASAMAYTIAAAAARHLALADATRWLADLGLEGIIYNNPRAQRPLSFDAPPHMQAEPNAGHVVIFDPTAVAIIARDGEMLTVEEGLQAKYTLLSEAGLPSSARSLAFKQTPAVVGVGAYLSEPEHASAATGHRPSI